MSVYTFRLEHDYRHVCLHKESLSLKCFNTRSKQNIYYNCAMYGLLHKCAWDLFSLIRITKVYVLNDTQRGHTKGVNTCVTFGGGGCRVGNGIVLYRPFTPPNTSKLITKEYELNKYFITQEISVLEFTTCIYMQVAFYVLCTLTVLFFFLQKCLDHIFLSPSV